MKGRHRLVKGGYVFIFLTNNLIFRWGDISFIITTVNDVAPVHRKKKLKRKLHSGSCLAQTSTALLLVRIQSTLFA